MKWTSLQCPTLINVEHALWIERWCSGIS